MDLPTKVSGAVRTVFQSMNVWLSTWPTHFCRSWLFLYASVNLSYRAMTSEPARVLTSVVVTINAWNRIAIAYRFPPSLDAGGRE
jgi:hypothetical protein